MGLFQRTRETIPRIHGRPGSSDEEDPQNRTRAGERKKFPHPGKIGAIEAQFNNETGNIAFRADFPNPDGLLRHGQTGTILIHRKLHDAIVIPQRATYEILDKRYVYVVDKDDVVHRREIVIQHEMDDIFVIKKGVGVGDRIVLEGIRQVRDGEKVEYEFRPPEEVMGKRKKHTDQIVVTSPKAKDVIITQQYVCQIHSQRHIKVRALENGYLEEIPVKEGQAVKKGDVMFKIVPILYKAKLDAELAEGDSRNWSSITPRSCPTTKWSLRMRWHCSRPNWQRPRPRRSWRRPN